MKKFTADFETATWIEDETYVWAWATCEIGNEDNLIINNSIDTFIEYIRKNKNSYWYFHNLKFDGEFIIYWLEKNNFTHVKDKSGAYDKTYTTLINDMGQFYNITIYFEVGNKKVNKATIFDSLKIIPLRVEQVPKAFDLPIYKLELDYNKPRRKNHILKSEEKEYIKNDVLIMAKALKTLFDDGLTKMTQASNALNDFKKMMSSGSWQHFFPSLDNELDENLRQSYKRGIYLFIS